jgi:hypothetical protein
MSRRYISAVVRSWCAIRLSMPQTREWRPTSDIEQLNTFYYFPAPRLAKLHK